MFSKTVRLPWNIYFDFSTVVTQFTVSNSATAVELVDDIVYVLYNAARCCQHAFCVYKPKGI